MGDKYIIELEEKPFHKDNGDFLYRVKGFNSLVFDMNGIQKLAPYTEPDLEQVRKEAYDDGFKNAVHNCPEGCPYVEHARNEAYQRGYEQGYKDGYNEPGKGKIQVGDEVVGTYTGGEETEPFVIIRKITEIDPTYYFGIYSKSGEFCQGGLKLKKTGRHFPEIADVLAKMKENSNGNL